jgi:hypothetical protein
MPAGRPTIYTDELGESILALMESGLSLAAAAADLGVHRQRVYEWVDKHPEFADTVKLAQAKRQLFLERRLLKADAGPVVTSTIFALKNAGAEDWRDKQEHEHSGRVDADVTHHGEIAISGTAAFIAEALGEREDAASTEPGPV